MRRRHPTSSDSSSMRSSIHAVAPAPTAGAARGVGARPRHAAASASITLVVPHPAGELHQGRLRVARSGRGPGGAPLPAPSTLWLRWRTKPSWSISRAIGRSLWHWSGRAGVAARGLPESRGASHGGDEGVRARGIKCCSYWSAVHALVRLRGVFVVGALHDVELPAATGTRLCCLP